MLYQLLAISWSQERYIGYKRQHRHTQFEGGWWCQGLVVSESAGGPDK